MEKLKKTHTIAFRVDEEAYRAIEDAAAVEGLGANEWCRDLTVSRLGQPGCGLGASERLIYEEVACLRYLIGHGFKMLASGRLTAEAWEAVTAQADRSAAQIARVLIERHEGRT